MQLRVWVLVIASVGCGKQAEVPARGSATAPTVADAAAAVVVAAVDARPRDAGAPDASAAAANCLPEAPAHLVRVGADLVGCDADSHCWTIAPTGAVTPRAAAQLSGVGFAVETEKLTKRTCYEGLCWPVPKREADAQAVTSIWVAYHPDGKRAAIIDDPAGTIFDLATKQPIATFAPNLGNSLGGLWFAGNFVLVAGFDAGPHAVLDYHDAKTGKKLGTLDEFYGGGVTVTTTGGLIVTGPDLTTVSVVDGASWKGKVTKRKIPRPPADCQPQDPALDGESEDPKVKACIAFASKYYRAYSTVVEAPGGGFIGVAGGELFGVDKNLVETSRVKLAMCPSGDE
jgi:hypothetical protein